MKIIAHRGNLEGPSQNENSFDKLYLALDQGFDIEIDVWFKNNNFYLGHDHPEFKIHHNDINLLESSKTWTHAKCLKTASELNKNKKINFFFHENDKMTLTSKNYIWMFPNTQIIERAVVVLPENYKNINLDWAFGICTDFPIRYRK